MKTALITSGGGAKGAFTVGALSFLNKKNIKTFDVISGTSTGSLIAAIMADTTNPDANIKLLRDVYSTVKDTDILKTGNLVQQITQGKSYIFDTEPLRDMIAKHVDNTRFTNILQANTLLCLTAVSLQTGMPTVFTNKHLPETPFYKVREVKTLQLLRDALLASSSQPVFLPSVKIDNEQYVDGGNREVIPSQVAVNTLPDIIYVISNNPATFQQQNKEYKGILDVLIRSMSIFIQDVRENDIAVLAAYASRTGKKVIRIEPDSDLDPENPTGLRFDKALMQSWMKKGEMRAEAILKQEGIIV
jgi:NTE family protein